MCKFTASDSPLKFFKNIFYRIFSLKLKFSHWALTLRFYSLNPRCLTSRITMYLWLIHSLCPWQIPHSHCLLIWHAAEWLTRKVIGSDLINLKKCEIVSFHSSHVVVVAVFVWLFTTVLKGTATLIAGKWKLFRTWRSLVSLHF